MSDPLFESLIDEFLLEARERIEKVEALLLDLGAAPEQQRAAMRDDARRELHTLKGNSAMMGFGELQEASHRLEDAVEALALDQVEVDGPLRGVDELRRQLERVVASSGSSHDESENVDSGEAQSEGQPAPEARGLEPAPSPSEGEAAHESEGASRSSFADSVRIPAAVLDSLVEQLQEMVIFRIRLADVLEAGRRAASDADIEAWDEARDCEEAMYRIFERLQEDVMQLRLVPLKSLFRHLRRLVHDESRRHGKEVDFVTEGGDTPVDKGLLEVASDALGHLVRNAVIHGIEPPAARVAAGKKPCGVVGLSARVAGEEVQIDVRDDGGGLDLERLRQVAAAKGVEIGDEERAERLVFAAGVSTREQADLSSGRGIGLSAVMEAVKRQSGRVEVETEAGRGSRFLLRLPLTVSVAQALLLRCDDEVYALPFSPVIESRALERDEIHQLEQKRLLSWRNQLIRLTDLGCYLGTASAPRTSGEVVVIDVEGQPRALGIDAVLGSRDIVVKGLDATCGAPPGISGATILGDGRVILILDPSGIENGHRLVGAVGP